MSEISRLNLLSRLLSNNGKAVMWVYLHMVPFSSMPSLDKEASPHSQMSNSCHMMNGGWELILRSPPRYQNHTMQVTRFPGAWPSPLSWWLPILPFASSSYQHCRAFGEAESAVSHHQDRAPHARATQKPPPSSYREQGASHVDEMSGKSYKGSMWGPWQRDKRKVSHERKRSDRKKG